MGANQRRFERYNVEIPVHSRRRNTDEVYLTADVSRHGAFVRTDAPRPARELVQALFDLPDGTSVEAMCMVARAYPVEAPGPHGVGMGLDFFALGREDKDRWDAFIGNCRILLAAGLSPTAASVPLPPTPTPEPPPVALAPAPPPAVAPPVAAAPAPRASSPSLPVVPPLPSSDPAAWPAAAPKVATPPQGPRGGVVPPPAAAPIRRAAPRVSACFLVRLRDVDTLRAFYTRDISSGGAFVQTPMVRAVGDNVEVLLVHPESDEEFRLRAQVARVVESPPEAQGLGVRFLPLSADDQVALLTFIETGMDKLTPLSQGAQHTLELLQRAVELDPRNPKTHVALGTHLLEEMRDYPNALRCLLRGVELEPAYPEAHRRLHRAYVRSKDIKRAASHLRVAIALETVGFESITEEGVKT